MALMSRFKQARYFIFTLTKSTFARPKKIKTLVFILPKDSTVLNNYNKEISAKQVATKSDFLWLFSVWGFSYSARFRF